MAETSDFSQENVLLLAIYCVVIWPLMIARGVLEGFVLPQISSALHVLNSYKTTLAAEDPDDPLVHPVDVLASDAYRLAVPAVADLVARARSWLDSQLQLAQDEAPAPSSSGVLDHPSRRGGRGSAGAPDDNVSSVARMARRKFPVVSTPAVGRGDAPVPICPVHLIPIDAGLRRASASPRAGHHSGQGVHRGGLEVLGEDRGPGMQKMPEAGDAPSVVAPPNDLSPKTLRSGRVYDASTSRGPSTATRSAEKAESQSPGSRRGTSLRNWFGDQYRFQRAERIPEGVQRYGRSSRNIENMIANSSPVLIPVSRPSSR